MDKHLLECNIGRGLMLPCQLCLCCCRGSFLSHCRNAGWRVWGARGQPPCHRLPECFLLYIIVPAFPIPVCTTCRAQGHLWRPPHILSLCDLRPPLHLPPVDYWTECEWDRRFEVLETLFMFCSLCLFFYPALFSCRSPVQSGKTWETRSSITTSDLPSLTFL